MSVSKRQTRLGGKVAAGQASAADHRDVRAHTGAGWIVPLCGDITQMPGLARESAAVNVDVTETGRTVGLF